MIKPPQIQKIVQNYDLQNITIAVLGGHSALDVCHGAKKLGFKTLAVCQKGREKTYSHYYKTDGQIGCIDDVIIVDKFSDITLPSVQKQLIDRNAIFIHNRYFWVYCNFPDIESNFMIPIYGGRELVKLEERDHPKNQYILLEKAGIRTPKIIRKGGQKLHDDELNQVLQQYFSEHTSPLIVKANEAKRTYERAFFTITSPENYFTKRDQMLNAGLLDENVHQAVIEEFIIGAQINFNYFYSPLTKRLELMGTDTRRQTNLDGFLRLDAQTQLELLDNGYKPSMVENGHIACTTKESLIEKALEIGEKFVSTMERETSSGMIGPFALQGAVTSENGKEEIVIFDVSMRIPGSPGTRFTPLSGYLYGDSISYGERIAMELKSALTQGNPHENLALILT
ncbi:5-formaminoimidazole-4-carboxamide-1-(beta)-D-ribofuranosyl 5'-monophosphate synthetase [Candidatus Peregrinibacteria bacterium HGW-Peregrinibacteria-1]|jgi:5-formaminoimidazole-4-carboxamide-1-(beta)-D-ribofuranosyl 5'-monophosphate synthetase|nr:MAG: 5-formaminoimidazole-4-carboxamide-1-(beta)-D-ribofuranosyl 5'-monophosphate synthetase [Candidatus Peregrinibacteria bacterium HGW-Peregrinibacteria-1]